MLVRSEGGRVGIGSGGGGTSGRGGHNDGIQRVGWVGVAKVMTSTFNR